MGLGQRPRRRAGSLIAKPFRSLESRELIVSRVNLSGKRSIASPRRRLSLAVILPSKNRHQNCVYNREKQREQTCHPQRGKDQENQTA